MHSNQRKVLGAVVGVSVQCFSATLAWSQDAAATALPSTNSDATGHIVGFGTNAFNGPDIALYLGAQAFYNAGITGQNAIVANVEAGHIWNGHETLGHVTQFSHHPDAFGTTTTDLIDRHATQVGHTIGGRGIFADQRGIAYGADLRSGAIASAWSGNAPATGFSFTGNSLLTPYANYFGNSGVINSSWGFTDSTGTNVFTTALDGLATTSPRTTFVASAGNSGPGPNTVGSPGSGYNGITVGALQGSSLNTVYNTVASFSSRAPSSWQNGTGGTVVTGVRASVDIVAPGTGLTLAAYLGQTGGNNPGLNLSTTGSTASNLYFSNVAGTSFSAPIVAGAATLLNSYANTNTSFSSGGTNEATDSRVVKAVLLNSADKIPGWSNAQALDGNIITTTQSLDYASGAGALNIGGSYDQFTTGTRGVVGTFANANHLVTESGWDLSSISPTAGLFDSVYRIATELQGGSDFTATLTWFRERRLNLNNGSVFDDRQADLDLILFRTDALGVLLNNNVIAQSISDFNVVEHLHLTVPLTGYYGLAINYFGDHFTNGFLTTPVTYGLAWSGTVVPEPATAGLLMSAAFGLLARRRRRVG